MSHRSFLRNDSYIGFYASSEEKALWKQVARASKRTLSSFLRLAAQQVASGEISETPRGIPATSELEKFVAPCAPEIGAAVEVAEAERKARQASACKRSDSGERA